MNAPTGSPTSRTTLSTAKMNLMRLSGRTMKAEMNANGSGMMPTGTSGTSGRRKHRAMFRRPLAHRMQPADLSSHRRMKRQPTTRRPSHRSGSSSARLCHHLRLASRPQVPRRRRQTSQAGAEHLCGAERQDPDRDRARLQGQPVLRRVPGHERHPDEGEGHF